MRRIAIVRAGALLMGAAAIVFSVLWAVGPYQSTVAYRHAYLCSGGVPTAASDVNGCVATEFGVVTGRSTSVDVDPEGDTSTDYAVDYRRASGAQESSGNVTESLYDAATTGRQVQLQIWQGSVVAIIAPGGASTGIDPPAEDDLFVAGMLAWAGVGLLVWFLMGDGTLRHLCGNCGLRLLGWTLAGMLMIGAARFAMTADQQGLGTTVFEGALFLIMVPAAFWMSFTSFGADAHNGEQSLLHRSLAWRVERTRRRRERAEVDDTTAP
ncbi:MAG TPA: hypothetical protein VGX23_15015 [Actinocrinis sp.]|nr:hypothetical protein [Actinocrinis sp.]